MPIWHGSDNPVEYPCPGCGFIVFPEPPGSYFICPICDWEDDEVQLRFPTMAGGANKDSLVERQQQVMHRISLDVRTHEGYERDPLWRPLRPDEFEPSDSVPKSSLDYFHAAITGDAPSYYWRTKP